MNSFKFKIFVIWFAIGVMTLSITSVSKAEAKSTVDPTATQILQQMTNFLGNLQTFSVHTQNVLEDMFIERHRVDLDVSSKVIIQRPNKLQAKRVGDLVDQVFFYDGKTLTLFNPSEKVYSTEPAPVTIEETLDFARESLGLVIPAADLIYRNAFNLLIQDVTLAVVIGDTMINGVKCKHLLFSRPGVDFQIWVAQEGHPLPYKYVVTDTITRLSVSTVMHDWDVNPEVEDSRFVFVPPQDAQKINFLPL